MASGPPYTPVVRSGEWIVVSGQIGLGPDGLADGMAEQLRVALANLEGLLADQGATVADVVKTTVFLTTMDDYVEMNEVYLETFTGTPPARSAVAVAALPLGALVEVEAWARIGAD
jgi:2-iminobutanoate/2-iminopropanoate deaminase